MDLDPRHTESSTNDPAEILLRCGLFRDLQAPSLKTLVSMSRVISAPAGELFFGMGDPCPGIYVVGSGLVRIYHTSPGGKEHVLHFVQPGGTFAEVAAIGGFPTPAYARSMEPTVCALIPTEQLQSALDSNHALCRQLLTGMALWVRRWVGMLEDLVLRDASGRLAAYLMKLFDEAGCTTLELPVLKRDLASHLNLTSEALSRTLRRLADAGLIDSPDVRTVRLLDRAGLASVAEGMPAGEFS